MAHSYKEEHAGQGTNSHGGWDEQNQSCPDGGDIGGVP